MATVAKDNTASWRYTGFVSPPYKVILHGDDGNVLSLSGVPATNIELYLVNSTAPGAFRSSGSATITDATNGKISWQWAKVDLLIPGTYYAWFTVLIPGEPSARVFDPDILIIYPFAGGLLVAEQDVNVNQVNGVALSSSNPVPISGPVTFAGSIAATIADGAAVTIGTTTDAAYSGSGAASLTAILKGIYSKANVTATLRSLIAAWATNPAQTAASAADTQYKFGASGATPVLGILLQNNTGAVVNYAVDAPAGATSFTLQDKTAVYIDVGASINILHLSTPAQQYVNHATNVGIVFQAWG